MTEPIALERSSPSGEIDWPCLIAVVAVSSCLIASYPVNVNPFRQSFFSQIVGRDSFSNTENYALVGGLMCVTTTVSIFFPNITAVLGIIGGLVGIQQSYFLPMVI